MTVGPFQVGHKLVGGHVDSVFTYGREVERQVCEITRWFNRAEAAEIAHLFAAAPDLLEACIQAMRHLRELQRVDGSGVDPAVIFILSGAIGKARCSHAT